MGLFDGIKLVGDLVKGGIAAVKASGKLDTLVERSQSEFGSLVKPGAAKLYQEYVSLRDAQDREKDTDKKNAMTNDVEAARAEYLNAVAADAGFPQDFRDEITATLAEYGRINAALNDMS